MMRTPFLVTVLTPTLMLAGFFGCKAATRSQLKMDWKVAKTLALSQLPPDKQRELCLGHSLIVFVGNAENILSGVLPGSPPLPLGSTESILHEVILHQENLLAGSLSESECQPHVRQAMAAGLKEKPTLSFLAITDGPSSNDSQIRSLEFGWDASLNWRAREDRPTPWSWTTETGLVPSNAAPMEIHLPTELAPIVRAYVARQNRRFDDVIYLIKSHGSFFASNSVKPDVVAEVSATPADNAPVNHAFLFDAWSAKGPTSADLFHPYWNTLEGCVALSQSPRLSKEVIDGDRWLCQCSYMIAIRSIPPGRFDDFCPVVKIPAKTPSGESLGVGSSSFLGNGSKSLGFRAYEPFVGHRVGPNVPSGVAQFSSAVSYDITPPAVAGISTPQLPGGSRVTLLMLDSCHGDPRVVALIAPMENGARAPVVTITSPAPVLINLVSYSSLSATQYLMLALIPSWAAQPNRPPQVTQMYQALSDHIDREGLINLSSLAELVAARGVMQNTPEMEELIQESLREQQESLREQDNFRHFKIHLAPARTPSR
jgi:hypothetical protein